MAGRMIEWDERRRSFRPHPGIKFLSPRLRPNAFARLARFAALRAVAVFAVFIAATVASLTLAYLRLEADAGAPAAILLDRQTAAAEVALERSFPRIEATFFARLEAKEPGQARRAALALARRLQQRPELFADVEVPGTGPFYDRFGVLFAGTGEIEARVRRAHRMLPLFQAVRAAPDLGGFTALVAQIGRALEQGRSPEGLDGLLMAAVATVEAEIAGKPQPLDWPALAGLRFETESRKWFVIALPVQGREREAASFARAASSAPATVAWSIPTPAEAKVASNFTRAYAVPMAIGLMLATAVLGLGLGSGGLFAAAAAGVAVTVALTAGLAAIQIAKLDAITLLFVPAAAAPALLMNVTTAVAYGAGRAAGHGSLSAIMLAAQTRGPLLLALAAATLAFWITWILSPAPSLAALALLAGFAVSVSLAASLVLLPAWFAVFGGPLGELQEHWFDGAVVTPAPPLFGKMRRLLVIVLLPVSIFCILFLTGLRIGEDGEPREQHPSLDEPAAQGAVHLLVAPGAAARQLIAAIGRLPETGAIRWIELFLPQNAAEKRVLLRTLAGFLPPIPPPAPQSTLASDGDPLAALEEGLRTVANHRNTAPDLRQAAHRLRRAVAIFVHAEPLHQDRIDRLEHALFGGLDQLGETAARLSQLPEPGPEVLDAGLRRRFVAPGGLWRIEVLPRGDTTGTALAAALREISPAAAGRPVVVLARTETLRAAAFAALAAGLALAALIVVAFLQRLNLVIGALLPLLLVIGLTAAALAGLRLTLTAASLAAVPMALAAALACTTVLAIRESAGADLTAARAALLPPLVVFAAAAPLAISTAPPLHDFGRIAAILLSLSLTAGFLAVPQIAARSRRR